MVEALLSWWYGRGWRQQLRIVSRRLFVWTDYFSFSILLRTLFAPYRQIGSEISGTSIEARLQQLGDQIFSRVVGFVVRFFVLIFGGILLLLILIVSLLQLVGWLVVPAFPIVGLILCVVGWLPWLG